MINRTRFWFSLMPLVSPLAASSRSSPLFLTARAAFAAANAVMANSLGTDAHAAAALFWLYALQGAAFGLVGGALPVLAMLADDTRGVHL